MDSHFSFSPAIQGLLVNLNPEYEITNDAISFVSQLSQTVLTKVIKDAARLIQYQNGKRITSIEIQVALRNLFPAELARQAISEAATALNEYQVQAKDDTMREAIAEFEVLDDDKKVTESTKPTKSGRHFIWFSGDLILKFLSEQSSLDVDDSKIDNTGTIFLASSLEYFVTRLLDVVGHKSSPTLTKPAFQSVFEEGEIFHGLWINLHPPLQADEVVPVGDASANIPNDTRVEEHGGSPSVVANIPQSPAKSPSVPNILLTRTSSFSSPPASPGSQLFEYLSPEPRLDVRTFVAPLLFLLSQACAGVEITSRAMQILASMAEFLLRYVVVESARVARYKPPHTVSTLQVQAAVRRALPSEFAREAIKFATDTRENMFQNRALLLVHSAAGLVHPLWSVSFEEGADTFVANVMVYGVKQVLVVAAGNAKKAGRWVINSNELLQAIESAITMATPIWKAVLAATERSSISLAFTNSGMEGAILMPPCSPRVFAADKIYFTSIISETPLQTDNQILIMFLFLASLSLRAIIVA
jgi:hypothetical protein